MKPLLIAVAAVVATSGFDPAQAQALSPETAALMKAVRPAAVVVESTTLAPRYKSDRPVRIPGVAQTAIEARLADNGDVVGALGFMCGLKPGAERYGVAAARGYDETGRFIGARLRVALR